MPPFRRHFSSLAVAIVTTASSPPPSEAGASVVTVSVVSLSLFHLYFFAAATKRSPHFRCCFRFFFACRHLFAVSIPASLPTLLPLRCHHSQAKPTPLLLLSPQPCLLPLCRRHCSILAAAIVATVLLLPPSKYRAVAFAVADALPVSAVFPSSFHNYCVAATNKQIPLCRCCCCHRLTCCRRFAVAVPASLQTLSPPHRRCRQTKPTALLLLSPPPCLSPPFRRSLSSIADAIVATALMSTPSKACTAPVNVAVAVAIFCRCGYRVAAYVVASVLLPPPSPSDSCAVKLKTTTPVIMTSIIDKIFKAIQLPSNPPIMGAPDDKKIVKVHL